MTKILFKKYKLIIFTMLIVFCTINVAKANSCTSTEKKYLINESKKIEIIPYLDDEYNPMHKYVYNVHITNFSNNFYVKDSKNNRFEFDKSYSDDLVFGLYNPGEEVTFTIYGAYDGICSDVKLNTIKVKFDYYNDYSTLKECEGIEEFYLCHRGYSGKIESKEWFLEQVDKYKKGEIENIEIDEEEKNILEEFFSNKMVRVLIASGILIVVLIFISIYTDSKKKIKINLNK